MNTTNATTLATDRGADQTSQGTGYVTSGSRDMIGELDSQTAVTTTDVSSWTLTGSLKTICGNIPVVPA